MQEHVRAVAFRSLLVLGELIWESQQRGARAGSEGKDEKGTKRRAQRPPEHSRQHAPDSRPQLLLVHTPERPRLAEIGRRRGRLVRGAARGGLETSIARRTIDSRHSVLRQYCESCRTNRPSNGRPHTCRSFSSASCARQACLGEPAVRRASWRRGK